VIELLQRGQPLIELVGPFVVVLIAAAVFMGSTRYRVPAEGILCVLGAVGQDSFRARFPRWA
jgi:hypothetical protein